ncbi:MAG: hypothetical protein KIT25_00695 [Enhydrobacter sp.]|nr:MAG: hypothetical protein KIT25_00695 [Enhydrobacter sp.]
MEKKDTRFGAGNTAGVGRPEGRKNDTTLAREAMLEGLYEQAREVLRQALDKGSESAAKFVIRMVSGLPRGAVVKLDLPRTDTVAGVDEAEQVVVAAAAAGELSAVDALAWFGLFEMRRRCLETRDLERRVKKAGKAQEKNEAFADALNRTADGMASSERLERLEEAAKPDLDDETRYGEIGDRFFAEATPERAERVRAAAREVLKEQQQEQEQREREAAAAAARPAPDGRPPPEHQPPEQQPPPGFG